jgi:hypothetical protein
VLLRDWIIDEENPSGYWDDAGMQIYYNPVYEQELEDRFLEEGWSSIEIHFDFRRKVVYYNPVEKKFKVYYLLNINWDGHYSVNIQQHFATGDVGGRFDEEEFHHSIETEAYPEDILNDHVSLNQSMIIK